MNDVLISTREIPLRSAPIHPEWVQYGTPTARNNPIFKSRDGVAYTMVWDCTAGSFNWFYDRDETFYVLEGAASLTTQSGTHEIGPGSIVFFPAGSHALWTVDSYIRKVAFMRQTLPSALGIVLRAWRRLMMTSRKMVTSRKH